ncbi:MAG: SAM-dependent chlorinase/fluorinase [Bacteroidales bacterium]|nr:SAM-dependent chlorinase/fluorinase [Bacteroidales bacterium]
MAIITLTSDWGLSDYYVAAVKGTIYTSIPDATIVDITHSIEPWDVTSAAFVLRNCYKNFPEGTIHIIGIETEESMQNPHIALKANGHYFIGTDNDIFSLILGEDPYEAVTIEVPQDTDFFTFTTRDRFVKVAAMIAKGMSFSEIGKPYPNIKKRFNFQPTIEGDCIRGMVAYIDSYENVITNISKKLFESQRNGRNFEIRFGRYVIDSICKGYNDVDIPCSLAIFGSHGYLEIAINHGRAASLLGMTKNTPVDVEFKN